MFTSKDVSFYHVTSTLFDSGLDVDICGMTSCVSVSAAGMLRLEEAVSGVGAAFILTNESVSRLKHAMDGLKHAMDVFANARSIEHEILVIVLGAD
ncbi:hypothetical protein CTI12_AA265720 [Artemisia annua]|uniref:Uncharacterized protein n=1 Tax=Artemisia annua TaxID=35608 RepID=A0A2U1NHI5_ARTAN|nr:hypothetical protein CTI12_AA265720 [Artemisia annua]